VIEEACHDSRCLDQPDLGETRLGSSLIRIEVGHWVHRPGYTVVPCVCEGFQSLPLVVSVLPSLLLISRICFSKSRYRGAEVADLSDNV